MTSPCACFLGATIGSFSCLSALSFKLNHCRCAHSQFAVRTEHLASPTSLDSKNEEKVKKSSYQDAVKMKEKEKMETGARNALLDSIEREKNDVKKLNDYYVLSKRLMEFDGGPPRWFSSVECVPHVDNSPLLLFLPGIDGVGMGLTSHHKNLEEIFDIWCLHIPVTDRTPFPDLLKFVESTVILENNRHPQKPIYLVGESLGASLAMAVAACNPQIDIVLILSNPATSFEKSQLKLLMPVIEFMPSQVHNGISSILKFVTGDPVKNALETALKALPLSFPGELSDNVSTVSSFISVLANVLPRETLLWKLKMLKSASDFVNSRLSSITSETLILYGGKDQFLPSLEEAKRLYHVIPRCEIRGFPDNGHFLFLENAFNLVTLIKICCLYRHGRHRDYISDYIPPTPLEFKQLYESNRIIVDATCPVMLSTLTDGRIVKGLDGIPTEGPVLYVGYHMLLGFELAPLVARFLMEKNILLRGLSHPVLFMAVKNGRLPSLPQFDTFKMMGAVPVSGSTFFKLLSSKAHVLLYPGGSREACHRKGEQYKLFWPERSEFIRMAIRFGATIVPFGVVGEDDFGEVVFDYDDQMRTPFLKDIIKRLGNEAIPARSGTNEAGGEQMHLPGILPKFPGRFYYYFGKPVVTKGKKQEFRDRNKCHELYLAVKSEVENCLALLKEKREQDPFRNILIRLAYQAINGFDTEVPSFEL